MGRRAVIRVVMASAALLMAANLIGVVFEYGLGHHTLLGFAGIVNVDAEQSFWTWLSAVVLLASAVLAVMLASIAHQRGGRHTGAWLALGAVLFLASLDEVVAVHEQVLAQVAIRLGLGDRWVIPGAVLAVGVFVLMVRMLRPLPPSTGWRIMGGLGMFFGSALIIEHSVLTFVEWGDYPLGARLLTATQEAGEMLGVVLLLDVTLRSLGPAELEIRTAQPTPAGSATLLSTAR